MLYKTKALTGWLAAVLITLLAGRAFAADLPYYNSVDFTPHWLAGNTAALEHFHRIPAFRFTNQNGTEVTEKTVAGKVYVASFFFSTCPGICPAIRSKLSRVQDTYRDDPEVLILSHSIRPSTDSIDVLQAYARSNDIDANTWHLLTGDKARTYALAKAAYFANEDLGNLAKQDDFLHTENILLIDQDRHIRGIYNGLSASSVANLLEDISLLKQ
ncbi:MAG: SCO family protein [Gammaproteobacteria bacterium]